MSETDPLRNVLQEWEAPEPAPGMDARIRAAYRAAHQPSPWRRFWSARVSVPAPALAALVAVIGALLLQFRSVPPRVPPPSYRGYVTRLEATGFQPLPNGAARIVRAGEIRQ